MKKKLMIRKTIVLLSLMFVVIQVNAQIIINSGDMASPGDIIITSTGLNIDFINYEDTGEDFNWDFTQLTPINQTSDTFISFSDVSFLYQIAFFNSSNLVKKDNNTIPIPGFPITKQYSFLNKTNASLVDAGVGYSISGFPIPLKYNSPDILYSFPMEYSNSWNSYSEYAISIPNIGYIAKEISRSNTVDGWGTLTTPYGTFDVIRLRSDIIQFDSLYIDSLGAGLPLYREYTEYSWIGANQKIPLLKISSNLGGAIATYIDSVRSPSSVNNITLGNDIVSIFPNPTVDKITIDINFGVTTDIAIDIYNIKGVKIYDGEIISHTKGLKNHMINLKQLNLRNGIYFVVIDAYDQHFVKKIILN